MTRRARPPGSFGIVDSLRALHDPAFYARRAAQHGAVFAMAQFHRPVAVVTDLRLGLDVLRRERGALTHPRPLFGARQVADQVAFIGNPQHPRHRDVFERAMTTATPEAAREALAGEVRRRLEALVRERPAGAHSPDAWLPALCDACLSSAMLGVSSDDARFEQVRRQIAAMLTLGRRRGTWLADHLAPFVAVLRAWEGEAREAPPERSLLAALAHMHARDVDDTAIGNVALLLWVTRSNVIGTLRWTLKELLDRSAFLASLREAADAGDRTQVRELARQFVCEVLRLHQSEFFQREVTREIDVGDYRVPRGWLFRVAVSEGHRDPRVFAHPHDFRPERFAGRHYAPDEYVPFSDGTHSAYGAALAVAIAESLVESCALDFEGRVVADGAPVRERMRHWSHWRPSLAWRVALERRVH